jgi:hypothetical integral membrane protein (TIGR02206 family)
MLATHAAASPFVSFGSAHRIVIAVTFVLPLGLAALVRAARSSALARAILLVFAAELAATWALWYWLIVSRGWVSLATILPMDLCDWGAIAALVTLIWPNQRSYELGWFWALSGTVQALLTPDLAFDFPDLRFIVFFAFHGGAIASVLYLTFGLRMRPWPASLPRVAAWSLAYFLSALALNAVLHTNFGYLRAKPAHPSLLDYLGPWPIYVFALFGLGLLYILVLYAPFFLSDAVRKARQGDTGR